MDDRLEDALYALAGHGIRVVGGELVKLSGALLELLAASIRATTADLHQAGVPGALAVSAARETVRAIEEAPINEHLTGAERAAMARVALQQRLPGVGRATINRLIEDALAEWRLGLAG